MKKKMIALLAAAMMTLAAGNAFAAFSNGDLIQVVFDGGIGGGVGTEIATDLGSITTLESDVNTTVANIGAGTATTAGTGSSTAYVEYFSVTNSTHSVSVAGTAPTLTNGISPLTYVKNTSGSDATALNAVTGYYATTAGSTTDSFGNALANANTANGTSLYTKMNASGSNLGVFGGLFNVTNQANTISSLASLATPINLQLYTFSNVEQTPSTSNQSAPNVAIEIASNGNVIINATQPATTPIPAAAYLLGSGLLGLLGFRRKNNA